MGRAHYRTFIVRPASEEGKRVGAMGLWERCGMTVVSFEE
jgi:hypothetical protein